MQLCAVPFAEQLSVPAEAVTVYFPMGSPPVVGASQVTRAAWFLPVAVGDMGFPGVVGILTVLDGAEGWPVPIALVAVTTKPYAAPGVRPLTLHSSAAVAQCLLPVDAVTVYLAMGLPPVVGAFHETMAEPLAGLAEGASGLAGTVST